MRCRRLLNTIGQMQTLRDLERRFGPVANGG
jgi:hypothetical protein